MKINRYLVLLISFVCLLANAKTSEQKSKEAVLKQYFDSCYQANICNGSFLIYENDGVTFSASYGINGDATKSRLSQQHQFDIGSIAKQFTAVAVLHLRDKKELKLSDPVHRYLPKFPYKTITIRHLLTHQSGIPDALKLLEKKFRAGEIKSAVTHHDAFNIIVEKAPKLHFNPGAQMAYSNTGYMVLAELIARVTQSSFHKFMHQSIFKPANMNDTLVLHPSNKDELLNRAYGFRRQFDGQLRPYDQIPRLYVSGAGGIYSTIEDLLKWQKALLNHKVITKASWKEATSPVPLSDGSKKQYGYGLSLRTAPTGEKLTAHGGHWRGFKSLLAYFPESSRIIIGLTNNGIDDELPRIAFDAIDILGGDTSISFKPVLSDKIYKLITDKKFADFKQLMVKTKDELSQTFSIDENRINALGYFFVRKQEFDNAIKAFELNKALYSKSANVYDSLAEAYLAIGDKERARVNSTQALAINPEFKEAKRRLEKLRK